MANIKTTPQQWAKAREYFEAGLTLSEIEKKTGISRPSISKMSHREGWPKGNEKKQLIAQAVDVLVAKENLSETAIEVHDEIVSDLTKHIVFFSNAAVRNVKEAMQLPCETHSEYRLRAETILKGKEVVLGKTPDTAIQINNNTTPKRESSANPADVYQELIKG